MIAGGFHPCQYFSIDTAGILMEEETGLNHLQYQFINIILTKYTK